MEELLKLYLKHFHRKNYILTGSLSLYLQGIVTRRLPTDIDLITCSSPIKNEELKRIADNGIIRVYDYGGPTKLFQIKVNGIKVDIFQKPKINFKVIPYLIKDDIEYTITLSHYWNIINAKIEIAEDIMSNQNKNDDNVEKVRKHYEDLKSSIYYKTFLKQFHSIEDVERYIHIKTKIDREEYEDQLKEKTGKLIEYLRQDIESDRIRSNYSMTTSRAVKKEFEKAIKSYTDSVSRMNAEKFQNEWDRRLLTENSGKTFISNTGSGIRDQKQSSNKYWYSNELSIADLENIVSKLNSTSTVNRKVYTKPHSNYEDLPW